MKTKNSLPLVSVVTVVWNGAKTIRRTIESVVNQTYSNIEYIIIDGGSTDGTVDIIENYARRIAYWVSEPDGGIYDAMNKGIKRVSGSIVCILNADDYYVDDAIECVVSEFISHPDVSAIYGDISLIGTSRVLKPKINLAGIENEMNILHPSFFCKKSVYDMIGLFDVTYKTCSDWDFLIRVYKSGLHFLYCNRITTWFDIGGVSGSFTYKIIKEKFRIRINYTSKYVAVIYYVKDILLLLLLRFSIKKEYC